MMFSINFGRKCECLAPYIFVSRRDDKAANTSDEKSVKSCVCRRFWCFFMYSEVFV